MASLFLRKNWGNSRFSSQRGDGTGTIIAAVAALCIGSYLFFAIVDWIKGTKEERMRVNEENRLKEIPKTFKPRELPGSKLSY